MIDPQAWLARCEGLGPFLGVPCSHLGPLLNVLGERFEPVNNEGEAVAVACGAALAGRRPVVLMQNSGLGNAVNPLTALAEPLGVKLLLLVSWRGEPGRPDEPQHQRMGHISGPMLELMGIGCEPFTLQAFERAVAAPDTRALLLPAGTFAAHPAPPSPPRRPPARFLPAPLPTARAGRGAMLAGVSDALRPETLLLATVGYTGRQLFALRDRPGNLYAAGGMGCVSSLGLGLARALPERPVAVLDGDGAALMRLEAFASIGHYRPANFIHFLLDNATHDSTGGQPTLAGSVDFPAVAQACGYAEVRSLTDPAALAELVPHLQRQPGPHFVYLPIVGGTPSGLGRPGPELIQRFREQL